MKLQPMTRGRWVELFFGAVLPAVFVMPVLLWGLGFLLATMLGPEGEYLFNGFFLKVVPGLLLAAIPVAALLCLGLVILFGPDQVCRFPSLRWTTVVTGFLGLIYFFQSFLRPVLIRWSVLGGSVSFSPAAIFYRDDWRLPLVGSLGPVILWLKYLPQLLRRTR